MKTATISFVRVEPELLAGVESPLGEVETVSEFVEGAVLRRRNEAEFIARGTRSLDDARRTGNYADAELVMEALQKTWTLHVLASRLPDGESVRRRKQTGTLSRRMYWSVTTRRRSSGSRKA